MEVYFNLLRTGSPCSCSCSCLDQVVNRKDWASSFDLERNSRVDFCHSIIKGEIRITEEQSFGPCNRSASSFHYHLYLPSLLVIRNGAVKRNSGQPREIFIIILLQVVVPSYSWLASGILHSSGVARDFTAEAY